jgi:hypothetical protein
VATGWQQPATFWQGWYPKSGRYRDAPFHVEHKARVWRPRNFWINNYCFGKVQK